MGDIVRWTDAPRGMLINPKGEWCSYADVESALAASEQRVREYDTMFRARDEEMQRMRDRLDAAEKLLRDFAKTTTLGGYSADYMRAKSAEFISPTPPKPAAGEEIDCVRCGNKHSGGC